MWEEEQAAVSPSLKPFLRFGVFMLRGLAIYGAACFLCFQALGRVTSFRLLVSSLYMPGILLARHLPPPFVPKSCGTWFCGLGETALWGGFFDLVIFSTLFGWLYVACRRLWSSRSVD